MDNPFTADGSDGIANAEKAIKDAGGVVHKGYLGSDANVYIAIDFLIHEWDYAMA